MYQANSYTDPSLAVGIQLFSVAIWALIIYFVYVYRKSHKKSTINKTITETEPSPVKYEYRSNHELLRRLRQMKPQEFEHYIAEMFEKLGYRADVTGGTHDGGIDIIVRRDGVTSYVQCKKYVTRQVSVGGIRDFYGAVVDKLSGGQGYFVTTNIFTLEARHFAYDKPIELVDGTQLLHYIRVADMKALPEVEIDYSQIVHDDPCPWCGRKLVVRNGKMGDFIGCSGFPRCRYIKRI